MGHFSKIILLLLFVFNSTCFADNLVLSAKLRVDYPTPMLIGHTRTSLLVKYKNWTFSHELLDPKNFYQQIDLTGLEKNFVKGMFDKKERSKLPEWIAVLAKEQANAFGITPGSVERFLVGSAEVFTVHDKKNTGQIFVLDELVVHQLTVLGSKTELNLIAHSIKER